MRLLRLALICSTLLLGGCWLFQEKSEPEADTITSDELVQSALLNLLRATSYHYDLSLESTIQYPNKETGRVIGSAKGDRMKLGTNQRTSSNSVHAEFALPARSDIGPVTGTVTADTIHAENGWFIQLHALDTKHAGLKAVFDTYLTPYLDEWVALSDADVTQITTPIRTSVLGYIGQALHKMFPDEDSLAVEARNQLRSLQDTTAFFHVTREDSPTVSNSYPVRTMYVELDTTAVINYLKQVSQILNDPMTTEEGAALRAFLESARLTGIFEIEETTNTPFRITFSGSILESQSPTEKIQHSTIQFEIDIEFSSYGTIFTITEPNDPESFEVVLDSIFAKPIDTEGNPDAEVLSE